MTTRPTRRVASILFAGQRASDEEMWLRDTQAALVAAGVPCEIEWTSGYIAVPRLDAFPQITFNDEGASFVASMEADSENLEYPSRRPSPARAADAARKLVAQRGVLA